MSTPRHRADAPLAAAFDGLDTDQILRALALHEAVATIGQVGTTAVQLAQQYYTFLTAGTFEPPFTLTGTEGPIRKQPVTKEPNMSVQLPDDSFFVLTIAETDSKGVPINTDTLTWSSADTSIVTVDESVDPSTYSAALVAGSPGEVDVTITDGAASFVEHVTVVPSAVATISATEGPIQKQPVVPAGP